ncbi:MAG: phage holin family protein [Gemmatimonadaceae bacterium]|nr:phage holin family protein [Gemmatimonadaceae bacterium]
MTAPAQRMPIDPDAAIPSLVRSLADDSKRLLGDEVRLAKLETKESIKEASRGLLWMALAFGAGVVMLVSFTLFLATLIGDLANGNMWVGALATGVIELALAAWLIRKGIGSFATDAYTLPETRDTAKDLASWARNPQRA